MIKGMTLGQYYPADSLIHKLDPRVKVCATFFYIICLFVVNNYIGYLLAALFLMICIALSKVPVSFMIRGMKAIAILIFIALVFNLFLTPGTVVFSFWKLSVTREGIKMAVRMALRLTLLIMGSSLMTLTTTPNDLTDALEKLLKPLRHIRVPVHEIAMMMSIALRFIPILMEEVDKIMKAQMARGADFESGNMIKKAKAMVPILVPLFVSAFRRANDLALAMESRCYRGGDGRTKMKPLIYSRRDRISYAVVLLFTALCIFVSVYPLPLRVI